MGLETTGVAGMPGAAVLENMEAGPLKVEPAMSQNTITPMTITLILEKRLPGFHMDSDCTLMKMV